MGIANWKKGAIVGGLLCLVLVSFGCLSDKQVESSTSEADEKETQKIPTPEIIISMKHINGNLEQYFIAIYENRTVVYSDYTGNRSTKLTQDEVDKLVKVFEENDFFSLDEKYECPADYSCQADAGWWIVSFKKGELLKTVSIYAGYPGPKEHQNVITALVDFYMGLPLVLWGPIPPNVAAQGGPFQIDKPIKSITYAFENTTYLEYPEDSVTIKHVRNRTFIGVEPKTETREDLVSYRKKCIRRFKYYIDSGHAGERVSAGITFAKPLAEEEVVEIANSSGFSIGSLSYISTDGGGVTPYPINHERMAAMEGRLAEFESTYNNITDFVLIVGFVSARVLLEPNSKLLENNNLYLVDIGPVEFLEAYPDAIIGHGRGLPHTYNKFIVSQDAQAPKINSVNVSPRVLTQGSTFTATVNVTDNVAVDKVNVTISDFAVELTDWDGDGIFTGTGRIPSIDAGEHGVVVVATDLAENHAYDNSSSIIIE